MSAIGSCEAKYVAKLVSFSYAANLQMIYNIMLASVRAFSDASSMDMDMGNSYLDVSLRIWWPMNIYNQNLVSILMDEKHTGEAMFEEMNLTFKILYAPWASKIVGFAKDGDLSMTGLYKICSTRKKQIEHPGFIRDWCGDHQLDLCMQTFYKAAMNYYWSWVMKGFMTYLRRQQHLITEMGVQCALVCDTFWLNMVKDT